MAKYIVIEHEINPEEQMIIFSELIDHKQMAMTFEEQSFKIVSAGKIYPHVDSNDEAYCGCEMGSFTLNIVHNAERWEQDNLLARQLFTRY